MPIFHFCWHSETGDPNFRGSVIGSFAVGHVFGELEPFFQFFIMANANFPYPLTLEKLETQTLPDFTVSADTRKTRHQNFRGISNWEFCCRTCFGGARAIFSIFHNGPRQFSTSVDTRKTRDPNFRGSVIESFPIGCVFGELEPFFQFFIMANAYFPFLSTLRKLETQTLGGSVFRSFTLGCVLGS